MAITWTNDYEGQAWLGEANQLRFAKGTPAASDYPTTGYPINPQTFGLAAIRGFIIVGVDSASATTNFTTAVLWQYNHTTGKLQAFWTGGAVSTALAEVAAGTDLSAFAIRVWITAPY